MTEQMISRLIDMGCRRWTKGDHDRLYIDYAVLGLQVERYKTGNISYAEFQGERISNSRAADLADVKVWIDLHTGEIHTKGYRSAACSTMHEAAEELIETIEAEIAAEETTQTETYYFPNDGFNIDAYWGDISPVCMDRATAEIDLANWNDGQEGNYLYVLHDYREHFIGEEPEPFVPVTFDEMFHEATEAEIAEYGIA